MQFVLKYLARPLVGAVIGYFTNFIAVKMLFFPKREIRVFGKRLPFTPGAIPKGKERLAKAVAQVVSSTLITKEDIAKNLLAEDNAQGIADSLKAKLSEPVKSEVMALTDLKEQEYIEKRNKVADMLSCEILETLKQMDLARIVVDKGGQVVKDKVQGSMLKMFLSDERIDSLIEPVGEEFEKIVSEQGLDYIRPAVKDKLIKLERQTGIAILEGMDVSEQNIDDLVTGIYIKAINAGVGKLMKSIDIGGIVETKINDMSIDTMEQLVINVMNKELNMIVNLGALIGFLLGLLNLVL